MSEWKTDSGLFTGYEGTVGDAWYMTDPQVGDGQVFQLHLEMRDIDQPAPDGKAEWIERFSLGQDWKSMDGGKTVQHPSKNTFNKRSQMGRLVDRLVEIIPEGILQNRSPRQAESFIGMRFHMEEETSQKGTQWESTRNFPTKFLGIESASQRKALNGQAVAPSAKDGAAWVEYLGEGVTAVRGCAELAADHPGFLNLVLDIPGMADDNALVTALAEDGVGSLYQILKG